MGMATPRAGIEAKTQAAGLSGAAAGIILWVLQTYVFKGTAVPAGLVSLIDALVPGLVAFAGAYLAPHTPRAGVWTNVPADSIPQAPGNLPAKPPQGSA